jgi:NitT/TauT family transport system permease protein
MPATDLREELAGIDALESPLSPERERLTRLWEATWPKLAAAALALLVWQVVVATGWRPDYVLPGPLPVLERLVAGIAGGDLLAALGVTLRRAAVGYTAAMLAGTALGLVVSLNRTLRTAVGASITALQTMPSIAWFPLAILLFGLSEQAIFAVVVLGAAPSIANGLLHGIDHIPPLLRRAGHVLGARGLSSVRYVILPAAVPGYVAGMKQGWAFAWRSLMAGELLVIIASRPSLGVRLQFAREISDATGLLAVMLIVFLVGILVDTCLFSPIERGVRRRWGLSSA